MIYTSPINTSPLSIARALSIALLALTLVACVSGPANHDIRHIVVFGDSNVDNGNLERLIGNNQPLRNSWQGRNSNGPVVIDYLAEDLNVELENYAVGGATTGNVNVVGKLFPSLKHIKLTGVNWQVEKFVSEKQRFRSTDLVILWAGSNDILQMSRTETTALNKQIAETCGNIEATLNRFRELGAKNVIVATRTVRSTFASDDDLNGQDLNKALINVIQQMPSIPNFNVQIYDAYASIKDMLINPTRYGFSEDVSRLCVDTPACKSERFSVDMDLSNSYINWDFAYKTTRVHRLMADQLLAMLWNRAHSENSQQ